MNCVWARSTLPSLLSANVTAINCVTEDPQRCTFSLSVRRRRSERYNKCELNLCSKFQSDCDTWTQFTNVIITDKTDNVSFGNLYFKKCHNKTQMWGIYSVSKTLNIWLLQFTAKWSQLSQIWTYCTWNTCRHPKANLQKFTRLHNFPQNHQRFPFHSNPVIGGGRLKAAGQPQSPRTPHTPQAAASLGRLQALAATGSREGGSREGEGAGQWVLPLGVLPLGGAPIGGAPIGGPPIGGPPIGGPPIAPAAENWGHGWMAVGRARRDKGLPWTISEAAWRLHWGVLQGGALRRSPWTARFVRARLHHWFPSDWDGQWKLPHECWMKTNEEVQQWGSQQYTDMPQH